MKSNAAAAVAAALSASKAASAAAKSNGKGSQRAAFFTGQASSYTVVALIDAFLGKRPPALGAAFAAGMCICFCSMSDLRSDQRSVAASASVPHVFAYVHEPGVHEPGSGHGPE